MNRGFLNKYTQVFHFKVWLDMNVVGPVIKSCETQQAYLLRFSVSNGRPNSFRTCSNYDKSLPSSAEDLTIFCCFFYTFLTRVFHLQRKTILLFYCFFFTFLFLFFSYRFCTGEFSEKAKLFLFKCSR